MNLMACAVCGRMPTCECSWDWHSSASYWYCIRCCYGQAIHHRQNQVQSTWNYHQLQFLNFMRCYSTGELLQFLRELDQSDVSLTDWEIDFLESMLGKNEFTPRQKAVIQDLIDRYDDQL